MPHGFYREELELPHKPIPLAIYLILEEALRVSWNRLRKDPPVGFHLETAKEDVITHELQKVLINEIFNSGKVDGFTSDYFERPGREPKIECFNETRPDLMPDLLVGMISRPKARIPSQDYLFVECKPVDSDHAAGGHYCDKGLIRFVRGDYAWAMTSALMVGYAHSDYAIAGKLNAALEKRVAAISTLSFPQACSYSKSGTTGEATHSSEHLRTFKYLQTGKAAPPITIRHLWLKRN